jgi:hypothetical protein
MSTFRAHVFFLLTMTENLDVGMYVDIPSLCICVCMYMCMCVFMYVCTSIIDLRTQEYEREKWTQFFVISRCSSPTNHLDHWEIMPVITASAINNLSGQFRFKKKMAPSRHSVIKRQWSIPDNILGHFYIYICTMHLKHLGTHSVGSI